MFYPMWMFLILLSLTCDYATGSFLQAISAALATIPLTGGPIATTAGIAGVKLAVGSKLLYYLGFFRRGGKASPAKSSGQKLTPQSSATNFPQRYSVPLPYMFATGGNIRQPQLGMPVHSFHNGYTRQINVGQLSPGEMSYLTRQEIGHGFSLPNPVMYGSQGFYPQRDFQSSGSGYSSSTPPRSEVNTEHQMKSEESAEESVQLNAPIEMNREASDQMGTPLEGGSESDVDSFFNFLGDMDDNLCISRLLCDIGADPDFLGEFSQNINGIISSLEVPPDSRAHHYVSIMQQGSEQKGGCFERFGHQCTDGAYEIVKSVAPTVGIPSNLDDLNL